MKQDKLDKALDNLCDNLSDKEGLFALIAQDDRLTFLISEKKDVRIAGAIAATINAYLDGETDEGVTRFSEILINAFKVLLAEQDENASRLFLEFAYAFANSCESDEDDEDEVEDCGDCAALHICEIDKAVKYRKEHGIPNNRKKNKKKNKNEVN